MRKLFMSVSFTALASLLYADEPKKPDAPQVEKKPAVPLIPAKKLPAPPKKEATLKVGDAAPKLTADKWLQGAEVTAFAADKVYVVEFWATWCGPCIVMMPHLAELQNEYRDKGVTFIGYTSRDPSNTLEAVSTFVKKRGPKLGYTFAYSDGRDVYADWMGAAAQSGIPCCFVVDKAGKLAYIGHPMLLDFVLPKVVAGQWTEDDFKTAGEVKAEISAVFAANAKPEPEAFLTALGELNTKYPWSKNIPYFTMTKLGKLVAAKKNDDACQYAKEIFSKAVAGEDTASLRSLSMSLRGPAMKDHKDLLALAVQAAEANVKVAGEGDFSALANAMETYLAVEDKAKATEFTTKAIAAVKTPVDVSTLLRSSTVKDDKVRLAEVLKAAEGQLKSGGEVPYNAFMNVADIHFALGDKSKAKEFGEKAVAAAKTPAIKAAVEKRVAKFADEKKDDK